MFIIVTTSRAEQMSDGDFEKALDEYDKLFVTFKSETCESDEYSDYCLRAKTHCESTNDKTSACWTLAMNQLLVMKGFCEDKTCIKGLFENLTRLQSILQHDSEYMRKATLACAPFHEITAAQVTNKTVHWKSLVKFYKGTSGIYAKSIGAELPYNDRYYDPLPMIKCVEEKYSALIN